MTQPEVRATLSFIEDMTLYLMNRGNVIEEQLKVIDEFGSYNTKVQLKDVPKIGEVFEFFEDIFDSSCQITVITSPHFETTNVVEDLSVEEDESMTETLSSEAIIEEFLSSIHGDQLETSTLDEELFTLSNLVIELIQRLPIGDTLPSFGAWFTSRRYHYSFLFEDNEEG